MVQTRGDVSIRAAAARCGWGKGIWWKRERDESPLTLEQAQTIAAAFGVPVPTDLGPFVRREGVGVNGSAESTEPRPARRTALPDESRQDGRQRQQGFAKGSLNDKSPGRGHGARGGGAATPDNALTQVLDKMADAMAKQASANDRQAAANEAQAQANLLAYQIMCGERPIAVALAHGPRPSDGSAPEQGRRGSTAVGGSQLPADTGHATAAAAGGSGG